MNDSNGMKRARQLSSRPRPDPSKTREKQNHPADELPGGLGTPGPEVCALTALVSQAA